MIEYQRYALPNGLRVIHNYAPETASVVVNVLYDTGARDESRSLTGIAHLFEHLMFGGSANVPDFDRELALAGGRSNAWTSNDFTNFYDIVPAMNVETAFHIESDRMLALSFSDEALEVQRHVVVEEFKQQCLNRPYGNMMHGLRQALYSAEHPYSWPVIGIEPDHILRVTNDDIRRWFYAHYAPNNAVLSITGNLTYERGRELVEKWFGDIPARAVAPRHLPDAGFPLADVTTEMRGDVPHPAIVVAIPMDAYGSHDYYVADCITDILAVGRSGRLYRNLVAPGNTSIIEADSSIAGCEGPGFLMLNAYLADGDADTLSRCRSLLLDELAALATPGSLTSRDLERTLNRFASNFYFSNLEAVDKARELALAEIHGDDINRTVENQRTVTLDDVRRVAAILVNTPKVTLNYLPNMQ